MAWQPDNRMEENTVLLRVKVIAAHQLVKKDIFGASDPYARVELQTVNGDVTVETLLTKTKKKTLNPVWNQEFVIRVNPTDHKIVIQVFDENRLTRDDFLGLAEISLASVQTESASGPPIPARKYPLTARSARSRVRGQIEVYVAILPPGHEEWELVDPPTVFGVVDSVTFASGEWDALPPGWEERLDANSRTYYVNHNARTTQWERPTISTPNGNNESAERLESAATEFQRRFHISHDNDSPQVNNQEDTPPATPPESVNEQSPTSPTHTPTSPVHTPTSPTHTPTSPVHTPTSVVLFPPTPAQEDDDVICANENRRIEEQLSFEENYFSQEENSVSTRHDTCSADTDTEVSDAPDGHTTDSSSRSSAPSNSAEGLPTGWSMQRAPNGRMFFIDHNNKTTTWIDPRSGCASTLPSLASGDDGSEELGPLPEGWEERVHSDGRTFFIDHNSRTTQWEDPRLSDPTRAGPAVPYSRDYKRKYDYFRSQLRKPSNVPNKFEIKVRRASILEDSYRIISSVNRTDLLKTKLWVEFENEVGLDYGGLAREWFFLLSKEMFNPYYGLFEYSAMDNYTLQINPASGVCNEDHLHYFKFIGRVAGMAIYHGKLLDAFFIRPFYKMMLCKPIDLKDMESVDLEYYNSLLWIKENDPSELELTFAVDEEQFGKTIQRELKSNGANITVTNENKDEYISLVIQWRFVSRVREQMNALMEGLGSIVPLQLLMIFDEHELELLLCGIQHVDVRDWRANTLYKGDYHANHRAVQWFWRVVLSFSNEMRSRLLQFVTGTSRVPMNGFKELYGSTGPQLFTIEKWGTPNNYPRAHTCFNRLDLPPYDSYQQLRDKLVKAIEGSQGFAGVD